MSSFKHETAKMTVADAISAGMSELQGLRDEVREIVDGAPENLQQSERIQTLSSTADDLDNVVDDEPEVPDDYADEEVVVHLTNPKSKRAVLGRGRRRDNAVSYLSASIGVLETLRDELEEGCEARDAMDELIDAVQTVIDTAESCEFPGMFG